MEKIGCVDYELDGEGLAWVTLNRPERRNALGGTIREDIVEAFERVRLDPFVRVVVLRGAGEAFCAGGDLKELLASTTAGRTVQERLEPPRDRTLLAVAECPKPVIAAVNGAAFGAGMSLALAADMRIASRRATFGMSFVRRGMAADYAGTYLLPRAVGLSKALELMYTADTIDADEALRLGVVSQVVAPELLCRTVTDLGRRIGKGAPIALRLIKEGVCRAWEGGIRDALDRERSAQNICFETEDGQEGMRAFLEKREPVFSGK